MIIQLTSIHDGSPVYVVAHNVCGITVNSQGRTVVSDAGGSRYIVKESPEAVARKLWDQLLERAQ